MNFSFDDYRFHGEINSETISKNRTIISDAIKRILPNSEVFIWLKAIDFNVNYFALSYSSVLKNESFRGHFATIQDNSENDTYIEKCKLAIDLKIKAILRQNNMSKYSVLHEAICDLIIDEQDDSPSKPNIIGWVCVAIPKDNFDRNKGEALLKACAVQLAINLRQGRDDRVLRAIEHIHAAISRKASFTTNLKLTMDLVKKYCSMGLCAFVTDVSNKPILRDFRLEQLSKNQQNISSSRGGKVCNNSDVLSGVSQTVRRLGLTSPLDTIETPTTLNNFKWSIAQDSSQQLIVKKPHPLDLRLDSKIEAMIYLPLTEVGLQLSESRFLDKEKAKKRLVQTSLVSHQMFFLKKNTSDFLAGTISTTDLKIIKAITRVFQGYLSTAIFEEKFEMVSKFFQEQKIGRDLDIAKFLTFVQSSIFGCQNVYLVEYDNKSLTENLKQTGAENSSTLPPKYLKSAVLTNGKIDNKSIASIQIGIDAKHSNGLLLEFRLTNDYSTPRLLIFELDNGIISKNNYNILNHLVSELDLFYRNHDSYKQRLSNLAQIRHAIIAPLSAANSEIIAFQKLLSARRHTKTQWEALRTRPNFWKGLDMAIDLGGTAKLLAESGRFLFSEVGHTELNIKDFNLDNLLIEINATFKSRQILDNILFHHTIEGHKPSRQNGDRALLYVALVNLVDNAIKYSMPEYSHIFFKELYPLSPKQFAIETKIEYSQSGYKFSVSNVGRYLPPKEKEMIFREFGRGKQLSNLNMKHGTGIGLTAANRILKAHDITATLDYVSEPIPSNNKVGYTKFMYEMPYRIGKTK